MRRKHFIWLLFIIFILGGLSGCEGADIGKSKNDDYKKNHPSAHQVNPSIRDISPDNKTLLLQYGSPYWSRMATYNIASGKVTELDIDTNNKLNVTPYYSCDGKKIVFTGYKERDYNGNIYTMNADGSGLRQITKNPDVKNEGADSAHTPAFSPDGKRIIFLRSAMKRERAFPLRGEMDTAWDIYEVNVENGLERRLTHYNFYKTSWPHYLADGKRFIFSGEGPNNTSGKGPKDFREYEATYQENFIFIMDGKNNDLKPALVNGQHSYRPQVSNKDEILFISRTNEMDGRATGQETQDLFLYKKGRITRITKLNAYITTAIISRDGQLIKFNIKKDKRSHEDSDWLIKSDGTGLKEIKIPMEHLKR
jgi:dipeptidyl aminopeptidase/acylaminoacyl peptidase